jgi:hypothetical protein
MEESMRQTMETGRILPKFVTPADVHDLKVRIDPFVRALDHTVATCAEVAPIADGWKAFSAAWRTFFDEEDSWWHTAAQMDQGEAYEQDVAHWQDMIARYRCAGAPPPPRITPTDGGDNSGTSSMIKTVAIAGAVIAVALGVRAVMK